jgi:hypothetical protein
VEERKELKQRHALIRRRLNKLLRGQALGNRGPTPPDPVDGASNDG